jgi:glutamate N-acetyltransferase / amino-acid N-acetyltransferase
MKPPRRSPEKVLLPRGFSFAAVTAGIKASGRPDLAFVEAAPGTTGAAEFTRNRVGAAPLQVARASLKSTRGRVRALLVNSGNANCATGNAGRSACENVCLQTARLLGTKPEEIFPSSTGIIGVPLPTEKIIAKLPELIAARCSSQAAALAFARALMTTDTRPKMASFRFNAGSRRVTLLGIAKGSGMIHPQLATMLVYIFTDIGAGAADLQTPLRNVCDNTFNCMSVDGDTSTNDTVLLLASGESGVGLGNVKAQFSNALGRVCQSLAEQIVSDGEGVQHVIRLFVEQSRNRDEALRVAKAIAHSALVKTAWAGADPNWGRILAAVGNSGVNVDPARIEIRIGSQAVYRNGQVCAFDERRAHRELAKPSCEIRARLGRGRIALQFLTTDLTAEYVHINADYST